MLKALPTCNFGIQTLTKCGEIFCYNFTEFTFCCTFCKTENLSFEEFVLHIKYLHFSKDPSSQSHDEDQEFKEINSCPKTVWTLKDGEKTAFDGIEPHNNPDNKHGENEIEYNKDFNDKELIKFDTDDQKLNYIEGFPNDICKLKDQEKNIYDNIEQSCHEYCDNNYDENELEHGKDLTDKDFCDDSKTKGSHCSESANPDEDGINSESYKLSNNKKSGHTNEITCNAVELKSKLHYISDENSPETFKDKEEPLNQSLAKARILQYRCPECDEFFFFRKDMFQHVLKVHNGFKCPECDKMFRHSSRLVNHLKNIHSIVKKFTCPIENCGITFITEENLRRHIVVHNTEPNFICGYVSCGRTFSTHREFYAHQYTHKNARKFVCDLCGLGCHSRPRLAAHRRTHTGEKPYPCEVCNKHFISKQALRTHIPIHAETRPYKCPIKNCTKAYKSRSQLVAHKYKHKQSNKFICDVCGLGCESRQPLKVHLRTHTGEKPYPCEMCGKRFATKSNLGTHIATHAEIRPHKCSMCNKAFTHRNLLKLHMYIHSDDRRFKCKFCEKAFKQPATLGGHIRHMHYKRKTKA